MSDITINLDSNLHSYLMKHSLRENIIAKELRIETAKIFSTVRQMQISPEQGQFMALLVTLLGARKTLDIGTFTGYSALSVGLSLPADGKIIACDLSTEWTTIAKKFWEKAGVNHKIELRLAPAIETLDNLIAAGETNTFDFSFIDADKENYDAYYEKSLALIRPGGLIAIDNVLWGGKVSDLDINDEETVAIRALNSKIYVDERVTISMLPLGDGLTLARKK